MDDAFTLSRSPVKQRPKFEPSQPVETRRQTVLFCGLQCKPGQTDLFETDGPPELSPAAGDVP